MYCVRRVLRFARVAIRTAPGLPSVALNTSFGVFPAKSAGSLLQRNAAEECGDHCQQSLQETLGGGPTSRDV